MKKSTIVVIVVVAVLAIIAFNGCSAYNGMVSQEEGVDQAWAKVEVQYQRRLDLIPNLVNTVKGYAEHEKETFENVTKARAGLTDAYNMANDLKNVDMTDQQNFEKYTNAQADLNKAFSIYVNAVKEAYPDLKADKQFSELQVQLEGTENRIATERGRYTDVVKEYNTSIRRFPARIWAGMFGFSPRPQYQADAAAATAPKVEF